MTLEDITRLKAEKLVEIRASKERINQTASDLFRPNRAVAGAYGIMGNLGSTMAIVNGVITGFKIIKRFRSLFRR